MFSSITPYIQHTHTHIASSNIQPKTSTVSHPSFTIFHSYINSYQPIIHPFSLLLVRMVFWYRSFSVYKHICINIYMVRGWANRFFFLCELWELDEIFFWFKLGWEGWVEIKLDEMRWVWIKHTAQGIEIKVKWVWICIFFFNSGVYH